MLQVKRFVFNPIQENTYVVYDETKKCAIIDPGCYAREEKDELSQFIKAEGLDPVALLFTHCHVDHVLGAGYVVETYKLTAQCHTLEVPVMRAVPSYSGNYGLYVNDIPEQYDLLEPGSTITIGNTTFSILFTPGHSPGSVCFYSQEEATLISGDVLFRGSIGRTDLPGGDFDTLMRSIKHQLFTLPADTVVYSGHGEKTTIGFEMQKNPFIDYINKA